MTCTKAACRKELLADAFFCSWCNEYVASPGVGRRANLFTRAVALWIDPLIGFGLYLLALSLSFVLSSDLTMLVAFLFPMAYVAWFLTLLRQGRTPGKLLLGLQVLEQSTGQIPGYGKMLLREIVGRFVSGAFLGLGYFWALFDKNGQAWHDKLAGTVVVKLIRAEPDALKSKAASA